MSNIFKIHFLFKKYKLLFILLLFSISLFSETTLDFKNALYRQTSLLSYIQNNGYQDRENIPCLIKTSLSKDELEQNGVHVESNVGNIFSAKINRNEIENFKKLSGIEQVYFLPQDEPLLDVSTSDAMTGSDYLGCDADYLQSIGLDGSGVILGILDYYPLNWKHEDFFETGWNTDDLRVLYIWNQNDDSGTHPTGYTYGSEYSKSDLMSDNGPLINSGNHGTQCTGIAAGDGSGSGVGSPYKGMSPSVDIIYIHKKGYSENTIDAFSYFSQKANDLGRPIIVSFSGGSYNGLTDGSDPVSVAIDNFCENGKMASVAVGNYYSYDHAQSNTTFGSPTTDITVDITTYSDNGTGQFEDYLDINFYYKAGDNFDVTVTDPSELLSYETTIADDDEVFDTAFGRLYIWHNDYPSIEVAITDEVGTVTVGDTWTIAFACPDATYDDQGGKWSAWMNARHITGDFTNYQTTENTLNVYASSTECLGVGAYYKTTGSLYGGCSAGLTFDGRVKPDIATPTSANTTTNTGPTTYAALGATSGAAPHAAGMVALLFQLYPDLDSSTIITYFTDSAWNDTDTAVYGALPNNRFGYGKMNCPGIYEQTASSDVTLSVSTNEVTYSFDTGSDTGIDMIFHGLGSTEDISVIKYPSTALDSDISDVNMSNYRWIIEGSGFTSVDIYFDINELAGVGDASTVNIYKRNLEGSGTFGSPLTKTISGSEIIVNVTSLSEFVLGSDSEDNPLPVSLSHFSVALNDANKPLLNWTTQSETENSGWNIYRGLNKYFFDQDNLIKLNAVSGLIEGAGTTAVETCYSYEDGSFLEDETNYWYFLQSVSIDGTTHLYDAVNLFFENGEDEPTLPELLENRLYQNYPNPFNPETVISFATENDDHIEISIFNIKGQIIKTLTDQEFSKGKHDLIWNGLDYENKPVTSGLYLYKLKSRKFTTIKKMLLLK
ncbi:MAG: S8 family serine peptidase [Candidatus Cloacimonetes bacterium]|nr:S8 family serine peptidase [Candidatus Cloacimonadota bacterium]